MPSLGGKAGHVVLVQQQHPVHGGVPHTGDGVVGHLHAGGDIRPQVLLEVRQDGQLVQVHRVAGQHHLVHGSLVVTHRYRRDKLVLVGHVFLNNALCIVAQTQCQTHSLAGAVQAGQHRHIIALHIGEEQRRTTHVR